MKRVKNVLCFMLSLVLILSSFVIPDSTEVKAEEDLKILDVYEQSYYNYIKSISGDPFESFKDYNENTSSTLSVLTKLSTITSSQTWYSLDGDWCLRATTSAKSTDLFSFDYQGSELNVNYDIPDVIRYHWVSGRTMVKNESNKFDYYMITTSQNESTVTGIGTAFNISKDSSTCASYTVTVPARVTRLDNNAFLNNTKVTAIDFKGDVQALGTSAFEGCTRLKSMNLTGVLGSVATNTIPYHCFYQCSSLENINIPETILNIGEGAFYQCNKIDYLLLSDSIKSIGKNAFAMCSNLRYLYIESDYQDWKKANIVSANELNKVVTDVSDPLVVNKGDTISVGDSIFGASTLAVIGKVDLDMSTVSVTRDDVPVNTETYEDTTYGYATKAVSFRIPTSAKGNYTVTAQDILGNSVSKSFSYLSDVVDTKAPVIVITGEGSSERDCYQSATITWRDNETYVSTVTFDGEVFSGNKISCNEEGVHTVVVRDVAGNEATKRFLIDTTLPVIEGVKDFGYYKDSVVITAKDLGSGVKLVLLDGENVTNSAAITCYEAGSHTVYVEDYAGNSIEYTFTIDTQGPRIKDLVSGYIYNKDLPIKFVSGCGIKEVKVKFNGYDKSSDTYYLEDNSILTKEGSYTITLKDALNNAYTYSVQIDKTAPVVTGVLDGSYNKGTVRFTITDNTKMTNTLNGSTCGSTVTVSNNGKYTIVSKDAAGNTTKVVFTKDDEPPTFSGMKEGKKYKRNVSVSVKDNTEIDYITVNGEKVPNGYIIKKSGFYTVRVKDKCGNTSTVKFEVDNKAPTTNIVNKKNYRSKSLKITYKDDYSGMKSAKLDGKSIKNKYKLKKEGKHTLVLTDQFGGKRTIKFVLDRTKPTVNIKSGVTVKRGTKLVVKDKYSGVKTIKLNGKKVKNKSKLTKKGKYTLVVKDKAGNTTKVKFSVK